MCSFFLPMGRERCDVEEKPGERSRWVSSLKIWKNVTGIGKMAALQGELWLKMNYLSHVKRIFLAAYGPQGGPTSSALR